VGVSWRVYGSGRDDKVAFRVVFVNIVGVIGGALPWSKNGIPSILFWVEWEIAKSCRQSESVVEFIETTCRYDVRVNASWRFTPVQG